MLTMPPSCDCLRFKPRDYIDPMIPPPLADVPNLPALKASCLKHERMAYAFLQRFTDGNDLLLRWRDPDYLWIKQIDGSEQVYPRRSSNLMAVVREALSTEDHEVSASMIRRVIKVIMPLTPARSGRLDAITPEALGHGLLALYSREHLRYEDGRWVDTINREDAQLPITHMRNITKRFITATFEAEGVRVPVTAELIRETLQAAADQSRHRMGVA